MSIFLDFEQPVLELEGKIEELKRLDDPELNIAEDIDRLETKLNKNLKSIYAKLTPWQKVQVARHQNRPRAKAYIDAIVTDFSSLAGDRRFAEDEAIIAGIGRIDGISVMVLGQERGADLQSRLKHNFGMARPEGYRKADRLMKMAERFKLPIVTFVDTPGAYPGIGAEERGQAEAIATCIETSLSVSVPVITVIIGEGGSGGAIALATADHIMMLEHAVYSVISPEGCASILWRDGNYAADAAEALKLTAQDLLELRIIDEIIPEPLGAAHRGFDKAITTVQEKLTHKLQSFDDATTWKDLPEKRRERFLTMGKIS